MLQGDARALPLADGSIQCVVTSPPYWGLRDYGVPGQLGLERTPEEYVERMVEVFREVRRVLRDDGTCWLNLGDSYCGYHGNARVGDGPAPSDKSGYRENMRPSHVGMNGLKNKDLVGIPWRVAFALQADGWWLRSDIIWSKPNPMPESITDRPTKAHEYLFLLTKSARYYYDAEAVREPHVEPGRIQHHGNGKRHDATRTSARIDHENTDSAYHPAGRNRRSVWTIATEPYPEAHFATFPEKLVEPCVLAGTSAHGACPACGAPWAREVVLGAVTSEGGSKTGARASNLATVSPKGQTPENAYNTGAFRAHEHRTLGWSNGCDCEIQAPVPCRVLDPFAGSGTTVAVAERLGRVGIGVELKREYLALARRRTVQAGLL